MYLKKYLKMSNFKLLVNKDGRPFYGMVILNNADDKTHLFDLKSLDFCGFFSLQDTEVYMRSNGDIIQVNIYDTESG